MKKYFTFKGRRYSINFNNNFWNIAKISIIFILFYLLYLEYYFIIDNYTNLIIKW